MLDIHSHILPCIDDGSDSMEESLRMARLAVEEGIHELVVTPHHANGRYSNEAGQVLSSMEMLQEQLATHNIPLQLHSGQEIRVYKGLLDDLHEGKLLSLAGSSYLLLEFPTSQVPDYINELLHELHISGFRAIIAHPERNMELANNLSRLAELINLGALAQMTTHSINGLFGKKIQDISLRMCESDLIHFLSSDAHNSTQRPFGLREAISTLDNRLGNSYTAFYIENAARIGTNQEISAPTPNIRRKKRFLFW